MPFDIEQSPHCDVVKMRQLIALLREYGDDKFNMSTWYGHSDKFHPCDTPQCICGWAQTMMPMGLNESEVYDNLGMTVMVGLRLSHPMDIHSDRWKDITVDHAVQAIENVIAYGDPKWAEVCRDLMVVD